MSAQVEPGWQNPLKLCHSSVDEEPIKRQHVGDYRRVAPRRMSTETEFSWEVDSKKVRRNKNKNNIKKMRIKMKSETSFLELIVRSRFPRREQSRMSALSSSLSAAPLQALRLASILISVSILMLSAQLSHCQQSMPIMCQHHQAMLAKQAAIPVGQTLIGASSQQQQHNLIVCPKSSQHNDLPQFPPRFVSPNVERQQREMLKNLNASFASHLLQQQQPNAPQISLPSELIDDELLNEIISPLVVDAAYERAKELIVKRRRLENELVRQGFVTDMSKPTAVARHQQVTTTTTRGNELEKSQEVFEEMSRILAQNLSNTINLRLAEPSFRTQTLTGQVNNDNIMKPQAAAAGMDSLETSASEILERSDSSQLLARIDLHSSEARHAVSRCEEDQMIVCDANFPYRHADGRCNNLQHPTWGKANTCFARLLPPEYSDGQSAPRVSQTGHPLPNPRILSAIVHRDFNYPATYTHFVMQYGQFFAHDIAFTPSSRTKTGQMIQCCPIERDSHPQCFPILVPPDDPFYSNWEESCLNFVRTAVCPRCRLGPREQMNQITSYIDGSQVYGSAANETAALWTKSGPAGRMHVSLDDTGRELLPHSADPSNDQCSDVEKRQLCYRAGDRRVNQHPALTSVHVIWLRQHNRIVNALKMINPHWNGDRLYQEAKRICTAQMQMVTYNEWLSLVIGQEAMKFLKLNVMPTGYTKYDASVDPSLLNEFAGAAFRFGHSMINNIFAEILPDGRPSGYRLNEFFFHPFGMKSGQHDMVMRGLISQASQNRDPFVSSDIKNHLYRPRDNPYGLDLPAFNIQRGRDHGIPGYTKLVEFCFDDAITNWKQLDQYMPVSQRIRFSKLYRSVHDLDLFSAGLAEYPLPGAALGPTFTCIVGIQMFNLKYGDRFWFEHGGQVGSFSPDQLQEIRKTNLARLICANSDNMNIIQKNVFRGESPSNPSVPCSSLPDTDLKAWMEAPGTQSVFSVASASFGQENEQNGFNKDKKRRRRRRQRPKQEPLGYAFRGSGGKKASKTADKQSAPQVQLGNEYTLAQKPMIMKQQQQQQFAGGLNSGRANREPPFGMPSMRIKHPKRQPQQRQKQQQQPYMQSSNEQPLVSSPALTIDQVLQYLPLR